MKISTILDHLDSGHMALPDSQRSYVWNLDQVLELFDSLHKLQPFGGLFVLAMESKTASQRGDSPLVADAVTQMLDGQQRMTIPYGVARGKSPSSSMSTPKPSPEFDPISAVRWVSSTSR